MTVSTHVLLIVTVLSFLSGCEYQHGIKQVRATADLQTISGRIEASVNVKGPAADFREIVSASVSSVNQGRDPWGYSYMWRVDVSGDNVTYVVLSTGSDGTLDVPTIEDYLSKPGLTRLSASEHRRDIVFRDGQAVVTGGK
jgi:hypothetical protein